MKHDKQQLFILQVYVKYCAQGEYYGKNEKFSNQNKMGIMPVGKLLFTMALPLAVSMLAQALYNMADMLTCRSII